MNQPACKRPGSLRLLGVQAPQLRETLEIGVTLDPLERLDGVILLAALELRDTQQQVSLGIILHAALGQPLVELVRRLVVLLITEIGQPYADVLVTRGALIRIRLDL